MAEQTQVLDLEAAMAALRGDTATPGNGDRLLLPQWGDEDWRRFLAAGTFRHVAAGETLIRRGGADCTLYLVLRGEVEVMAHSDDGISFGRVARVGPGSVVGEQSFFDGGPRSAGAWGVSDCDLAALSPEQFAAFANANQALGSDLLFALGRILAVRLRRTTARVFG